ncbi:hypothetical protein MTR67_024683 [Solanum verrucosum]|uniref:Uncharacterized protein n=1 Tax=Solanum verrucosum TaxID=315347 RepID=A0AAF0TZ37_SOLVR|nr:hypothetical protein MTR67_024683 [Solanum verrucosum]
MTVEREETWWELGAARGLFTGPWVLCGDFNTVRYPSEKFNCSRISRSLITDLSEFIERHGINGLRLSSGSVHMEESSKIGGRLQKASMTVKGWWGSFHFQGKPDFVLEAKLRALKEKSKEWSKTSQGNLKQQKQLVLNQLAELEMIQDQRILEEGEIVSRLALTTELEEIVKMKKQHGDRDLGQFGLDKGTGIPVSSTR